jgi:uncharacterized protein involved in exopolysaccharide biosynthesis
MKRYLQLLQVRWVIVLATLIIGLGVVVYARKVMPKSYVGSSTILTINENSDRDLSADVPLFINSSLFLEQVAAKVGTHVPIAKIQKALKVKIKGQAVVISYTSLNPKESVTMANAIADSLPKYYRQIVTSRFDHNVDALRGAMTAQRQNMSRVDHSLAKMTAGEGSTGGEKPLDTLSTQLSVLQDARETAMAQLSADRATLDALAHPDSSVTTVVASERIASDMVYKDLETQVAKDRSDLAEQRAMYTKHYPGISGLANRIRREEQSLRQITVDAGKSPLNPSLTFGSITLAQRQAAAVVAADTARVAQLDGAIARDKAQLYPVAQRSVTITSVETERTAAQQAYLAFAGKYASALADDAQASSLGSVVVADHAVEANLTSFGGKTFLMMELAAVFALALISPLLAEKLDPHFTGSDDVEKVYGYGVVGEIGKA